MSLRDLSNLTSADVLLTGLPALYYRLLKSDGATRILANPQLRTSEGIPAQARFGERVPVPVTTFAPIAAGGVQTQPITSFNYEPIGVNIDITPRMHHDDAVTLALKVDLSSISGKGFGDLPTFGSRQINTVIRLKDGETNMLAGLIRDEERTSLARNSRPQRPPGHRPSLRLQPQGNAGDGHHPDVDAAHRSRAESERGGSAGRSRWDATPARRSTDIAPPIPLPLPVPAPPKPPGGDALAPQFPATPAGPATPLQPPAPVKPPPKR